MKNEHLIIAIFSFLFIFSIAMISFQKVGITGYATEGQAVSNVTITSYLSIEMSTNLTEGILFGEVTELPATNINASHNYDGDSSGSTMYLEVSTDSNTNVDFCIRANDNLTSSGLDTIGVGNQTYSNSTTTDAGTPSLTNELSLTTSYAKSGINIDRGGKLYHRFWLDIPAAQPAGTYNNTVHFKGVNTGGSC